MLMPSSPSVENTLAATPGWVFIPAPTIETLPIVSSAVISSMPTSAMSGSSAARAVRRSSRGTVNDTSARVPSPTGSFWMIMSTLTFASASALKIAPGDARVVGHAEQRDARLAGRVGDGGDEGLLHGDVLSDDDRPGTVVEARSAMDADAVVARVLDRAQLQHPGAGGGHLEHLLEGDHRQLARVGHDARVGGEDAVDVRVDLAHLGAHGGGERDGGGVRAAAAERRDVLRGRHALEAGDEHDRVLVERGADAIGPHVEDPGLGVRGVCHNARL